MKSDRKWLSRKDFKDYELIHREIERMVRMSPSDLLQHYKDHPEDAFSFLPGTQGSGIPFTWNGEIHFRQIVDRGLRALGASARKYNPEGVADSLKIVFVSGNEDDPPVTVENAHDLFDEAMRRIDSELKLLTHHVPCAVVAHEKPERFQIGPVYFVRRDIFLKANEAALRAAQESWAGYDWGFEALRQFFSQFEWVASVTVQAAEPAVS